MQHGFGIGFLVAAGILAACAPSQPGLRVANGDDVTLLHPQKATSAADGRVLQALHAGLTRLDPATLEPEASLAEAFGSVDGGAHWWFRLRPQVRWSDGNPLTLADVLRSWQQLQDPAFGAPYGEWLNDAELSLQSGSAGGEELHVRFPFPRPRFAEMCAYHALAPVPAHAAATAVGSGPFRLVSRRIRDRVVVERNPYYWDAAAVALPGIEFLTVESEFTALNLFLAGQVDYLANVPALAIPALLREYPHEFQPAPQYATTFLRLNTTAPPFDRLEVRRAFARSVHSQDLAAHVGGGRAPAHGLVPAGVAGWIPPPPPAWRQQATKPQLLAELAQMPPVEYLYNSSELNRDVAEVLQRQWRDGLGVHVRLLNQERKTFLAAQRALEYQASRSSWIADYLDPLSFLEIFESGSGNNRTGWSDAHYDQLLNQARHATDPLHRNQLLAAAEARLLDQAPMVPVFHEATFELVAARVAGFTRNLRGYIDWGRLSLQEVVP